MAIGHLRDRVTIQQRAATPDAQGGRAVAWSTLTTTFANVVAVNGREQLQAAAVTAVAAYLVELRYRTDLSAGMRLQWTPYGAGAAKTLEIHALRPKGGERVLLLLDCAEVQA